MARKRSNGEGSVWKLKNGMWRGQLMDGYTDGGKKNIISFSGETRGEVLEKLRDYQNKKDAHIHVDKKLTLSNWADLWYCDYKSQVQASTYSGYQYTLKIIKEQMGTQTLCDVLPIDINGFQRFFFSWLTPKKQLLCDLKCNLFPDCSLLDSNDFREIC